MGDPRLLTHGVDTLNIGLHCKLAVEQLREWEARLKDAPVGGAGIEVSLGRNKLRHRITPGPAGWGGLKLRCEGCWTVLVTERQPNDPAQEIQLELRPERLASDGPRLAIAQAVDCLFPLLGEPPTENLVSRADLYVDFYGWEPEWEDSPNLVRRAHYLSAHFDPGEATRDKMLRAAALAARRAYRAGKPLDELSKLMAEAAVTAIRGALRTRLEEAEKEAEDQEYMRVFGTGRMFTGWQVGRGDVVARVYRKDEEIRVREQGQWWRFKSWAEVLRARGGPEQLLADAMEQVGEADKSTGKRKRSPAPVWRLEFQLKRNALREFNVGTFESLMPRLQDLWGRLAGEWLTLRIPGPAQRSRWPLRPEWIALRDLAFHSPRQPIVRERIRQLSLEASALSAARGVARYNALAPTSADAERTHLMTGAQHFVLASHGILDRHGFEYPAAVADYQARMRRPTLALPEIYPHEVDPPEPPV